LTLESGDIARDLGFRLTVNFAANGGKVTYDLGPVVCAQVAADGRDIASDRSIPFENHASSDRGHVAGDLTPNVDRATDAGQIARLLVGRDANVMAELCELRTVLGRGERDDSQNERQEQAGEHRLHKVVTVLSCREQANRPVFQILGLEAALVKASGFNHFSGPALVLYN
jgi:hypothetical protein